MKQEVSVPEVKPINLDRWTEGVIMTIYEDRPPSTPFTRIHLVEEITNRYSNKYWAKLSVDQKDEIVHRVMKILAGKKFVIAQRTGARRFYHAQKGMLKRKS